jgi:ABC-2 type transport system permease protein
MGVNKTGYERYTGLHTGRWERLLVLPRYAWPRLMRERLVLAFFMLAVMGPLYYAARIYVSNRPELLLSLGQLAVVQDALRIDGTFFFSYLQSQGMLTVILAALTGPGLIAPDLANNALPLYFSRPLTRVEYVLSRMVVLGGLLALTFLLPGIFLFVLQCSMAGAAWAMQNLWMLFGLTVGALLWILMLTLLAVACSAWVRWRVIAGALIIGIFLVSAGAAEFVRNTISNDSAWYLNPAFLMGRVWVAMLDAESVLEEPLSPTLCLLLLAVIGGVLVALIERRLRPLEVVR